jgi:polar amino acid transport system substrate-binding protein
MTIRFGSASFFNSPLIYKTPLATKALLGAICLLIATLALAEPRPLRVATSPDNPPLIFQAEGKLVGMEVDLSRLLQAQLGQPLQLQVLPRAELLPALARGDVDLVMAGLVITPQLEQQADFTVPYLHSGEMAIIRTDDVLRFRSSVALTRDGFRVGFIPNSAAANYVKNNMAAATAISCVDANDCLQALLSKRIDVLIDSPATSWRIATEPRYAALMSLYQPLNEEYFAWAVPKNNPELRERLDTALHAMKQSQMFEHILNRWIPVRISSESASD